MRLTLTKSLLVVLVYEIVVFLAAAVLRTARANIASAANAGTWLEGGPLGGRLLWLMVVPPALFMVWWGYSRTRVRG